MDKPKSLSLIWPSLSIRILSGLMSLCWRMGVVSAILMNEAKLDNGVPMDET